MLRKRIYCLEYTKYGFGAFLGIVIAIRGINARNMPIYIAGIHIGCKKNGIKDLSQMTSDYMRLGSPEY